VYIRSVDAVEGDTWHQDSGVGGLYYNQQTCFGGGGATRAGFCVEVLDKLGDVLRQTTANRRRKEFFIVASPDEKRTWASDGCPSFWLLMSG